MFLNFKNELTADSGCWGGNTACSYVTFSALTFKMFLFFSLSFMSVELSWLFHSHFIIFRREQKKAMK